MQYPKKEEQQYIYQCYIQILVLGAQGIRATGFKRAQGNAHCAKFESHTNRVTFETNAVSITSSIHALYTSTYLHKKVHVVCETQTVKIV